MKLTIYTRSYIKDSGEWDLSNKTIESVINLLRSSNNVRWVVLVSNYSPESYMNNISKFRDLDRNDISIKAINEKLSCSEARFEIYKYLKLELSINPNLCDFTAGYFMNLDSDDELINHRKLIKLLDSDLISSKDNDLIGFGLEVPKGNIMHGSWTWNKHKFRYARRYITTDTQTMFLFLHRLWVIYLILDGNCKYFITYPVSHPNESCDDTLCCLEMANFRRYSDLSISAVCANFIRYNIHEGQVSENQTDEYKRYLRKELKKLGYLYVNSNFYNYKLGKLIKYTPEKPKGIYKLINKLFLK